MDKKDEHGLLCLRLVWMLVFVSFSLLIDSQNFCCFFFKKKISLSTFVFTFYLFYYHPLIEVVLFLFIFSIKIFDFSGNRSCGLRASGEK